MKLIGRDNFCRDTVSDFLIAENVNEYYGKLIMKTLNTDYSNTYIVLVEDDYVLYDGNIV